MLGEVGPNLTVKEFLDLRRQLGDKKHARSSKGSGFGLLLDLSGTLDEDGVSVCIKILQHNIVEIHGSPPRSTKLICIGKAFSSNYMKRTGKDSIMGRSVYIKRFVLQVSRRIDA